MEADRAETAEQTVPRLEVRALHHGLLRVERLQLAPGEICGLTGPSGAGKTLLLRALADLDPHGGELLLDGHDHRAMGAPQWRRRVVFVAAESAWWSQRVGPHFEKGWPEEPARRLGFSPETEHWPVERLSTGEKQRLGLLRALALEPRVLLLDEPTSALDGENVRRVEELISDGVRGRGVSVLWVAHDPAQLERVASRCLRIESGVLGEGEPV